MNMANLDGFISVIKELFDLKDDLSYQNTLRHVLSYFTKDDSKNSDPEKIKKSPVKESIEKEEQPAQNESNEKLFQMTFSPEQKEISPTTEEKNEENLNKVMTKEELETFTTAKQEGFVAQEEEKIDIPQKEEETEITDL